jgi:hypothetical protein
MANRRQAKRSAAGPARSRLDGPPIEALLQGSPDPVFVMELDENVVARCVGTNDAYRRVTGTVFRRAESAPRGPSGS